MTFSTAFAGCKTGVHRLAVCSLIALCLSGAVQADDPPPACADDVSSEAIQAQRSAFNAAIAAYDAETIASMLADDVMLITGTDSDLYAGRQAQVDLWRRNFESDERIVYQRTPECIQVSQRFPIAHERGRWRGEPEDGRPGVVQGAYSAKWRHDGKDWRLEVEIYMTDECSESICPRREAAQ